MSELILMLLADARLPVAGHTQSAGLEPALRLGLEPSEVPLYLAARLASVTRVEAATAVVALHHFRAGLPLEPVDDAWAARTPSAAMRATSRSMGRAMLRLASTLWPDKPSIAAVGDLTRPSRGVVLGAVSAAVGLSPAAVARLIGYDDVLTVTSAALKLAPLDPAVTSRWALEALPLIERMAESVRSCTSPEAIPAAGSPQIEAWAEAHARTTRRLFSA